MKYFRALGLAFTFIAGAAFAQPTATLQAAQSEITFTSTQMGVPVDGRFRRFDARIALDPKQPASGSVSFTIDAGSASLGIPETDAELVKPDWFDAAKFPQATFKSTAVKALGGGRFEVAGLLSIKGSSQAVVVPVAIVQAGGTSTATGSFTLKRLAFGIGAGEWGDTSLVANDVTVRFKLALTGLPPL
jgi:polyisoprenoid-binding protein YceI